MDSRTQWIVSAVVALTLAYTAPHFWWLFGISQGFPGDSRDFDEAFQRTWFVVYNLVTTGLVICGAIVVMALERRWFDGRLLRITWTLILLGAVLLLLRGFLGLLTSVLNLDLSASGATVVSLLWELWFVLTGLLYALVALRHRSVRGVGGQHCADGGEAR